MWIYWRMLSSGNSMGDAISEVTFAHGKVEDGGWRVEIGTYKIATVFQVGDYVGLI